MEIAVSFTDEIPVLALSGRFDGSGSKSFDQESLQLKSAAPYWIIDVSRVNYLSSVAVRSLLTLEKRLKALGGGMVLTGVSVVVGQVLRVSGMDGLLRSAPNVPAGISMVQGLVAAGPVVTRMLGGCSAKIQKLPGGASTIDWWAPEDGNSANTLLRVDRDDLGFAFGTGMLGETAPGNSATLGSFVSTPYFAGVLNADGDGVSDFIVGDATGLVPVQVSTGLGVSGTASYFVEFEAQKPFSLLAALNNAFEIFPANEIPTVLGYVALAQAAGGRGAFLATGVLFEREKARSIDPSRRLENWPDPIALSPERYCAGVGVTLDENVPTVTRTELDGAVRSLATLDVLRGVTGMRDIGDVSRVLLWVFVPAAVRGGAEKLLRVSVEPGGEWRGEWETIVRRLYHDCRSVTLAPLHGGYMSKTFRAVAYDRDGRRTLPTVLKIGPTALTTREQRANRDYVSRFILNNGTTVLGSEQEGEWAGLRYNFLGINGPESELVWLRAHYLKRPVPEMLGLFERLVTHVLKPWYAQPKWEQVWLYRDHTPLRLFPSLLEVAKRELHISPDSPQFACPELGLDLPNPFHFLKHEYPRRAAMSRLWYTTICHGDLNLQNVLVDERDNLYVIDFSETRPRNVVSDFARMEPILKFEMTRLESDEDLRLLLEFEEGLTSVKRMDETPPNRYRGDDPLVTRAHAGIAFLRRCADRATLFEQDMTPYWIAMLEWTYSVVCYSQISQRHKRYAACSAALICRSLLEQERQG